MKEKTEGITEVPKDCCWSESATHLILAAQDFHIPKSRADTLEKIHGWAVWIAAKEWATPKIMADWLRIAAKSAALKLYEP